ncbi:peptide chain release factor N(5)-glutamine methyltransferase [Thermochromatium tepidum]|uniref:Release factor glutamine methyltransferase n=1 Tax=Thermochromatium tepidum ATCC 43061 TaxID=316276 RepID=A0A6I6EG06_THETI|nr:peptide chain release factor N(5)-glutamine methyltransferase [Thermochromatium tepidum]QGU33140.1 peptide chain release factor N(5)-glutamine methyltransferase [Thermochromatium tepidum ATCC 43061]
MSRTDDILRQAASVLATLPESNPRLEAELLLTAATGWTRTALLAWPERILDPAAAERFAALLARRLTGEPIAYILGRQTFWTLELRVTPDTLIPRPETELLIEIALDRLAAQRPVQVADLGTGSGAIAAALASERPDWRLIATDRSAQALAVARDNFRLLGLEQIRCLQMDWLRALASDTLDAILSNPPYIAEQDPHLGRGDLRFEPRLALTPGGDGLDAIRAIAADAGRCLHPGGLLAVEHGFDQAERVRRILAQSGLRAIETHRDLAGLERVTLGYR